MKKIKIMLAAITVMAAVGGALAFKAKKFGAAVYCSSQQTQTCPNAISHNNFTTTTTNIGLPANATFTYCSTLPGNAGGDCRTKFYLKAED